MLPGRFQFKHIIDNTIKPLVFVRRLTPSLQKQGRLTTQEAAILFALFFSFQSLTAARMASSANIEQCNFTGGNFRWAAMSVFLMERTSSTCFPLTHSVATEEEAIADPHPKVLNFDSWMLPFSSTLIWSCCVLRSKREEKISIHTLGEHQDTHQCGI